MLIMAHLMMQHAPFVVVEQPPLAFFFLARPARVVALLHQQQCGNPTTPSQRPGCDGTGRRSRQRLHPLLYGRTYPSSLTPRTSSWWICEALTRRHKPGKAAFRRTHATQSTDEQTAVKPTRAAPFI